VIAALARAAKHDIARAAQALEAAVRPRIHVFLATSDIHLQHKLRISRQQCLEQAHEMVRYAKSFCPDIEFSPEDATRTDPEFLFQVLEAVIESGATTLNIPDTVGYTVPSEFGALIQSIRQRVKGIEKAIVSAHCHNDLGLAVANSLAAIGAGAGQVECTINGIGERAGNASLEEIVMALRVRADKYPYETQIATEQLYPTSQMLEEITGISVQPNKAVIGRNAFAHEAGIHQDGMLKNPLTYEIMTPKSVGVPDSKLVLGKHSGRHALSLRCEQLGYRFERRELDEIYRRFVVLADEVKHVHDHQLLALIREAYGEDHRIPPARVEAEQAASAAVGDDSHRRFPGTPSDYSAAHLSPVPAPEHQGEQEDYLWGV
jgi:2-isopropylmalate synthase